MDADETLSRLFRQRRYLAVIAVIVGVAVLAFVQRGMHPTYRAESRLLLGPELNSAQEAAADVSRARAIATSTAVLATAIKQANVSRSVSEVRAEVALAGVGDSGLAQLSVVDADPAIAAALCRALGHATTDFVNRTNNAPISATLASVEQQLQDALTQYADVQARASGPASQPQLAAVSENINSLSTVRGQLLARQALAVAASVVDEPKALGTKTTSNILPIAGLTVVGTILAWLLASALMEAFRPTLPTLRSVARAFDAPALGRIRADLAPADAETAQTLGRVMLSAQHLDAATLVTGGGRTATPELVSRLDNLLTKSARQTGPGAVPADLLPTLRTLAVPAGVGARNGGRAKTATGYANGTAVAASRNGRGTKPQPIPHHALPLSLAHSAPAVDTGMLLITRRHATRSELRSFEELLRCTNWPIVGVVEVVEVANASSRWHRKPHE
jgi:hypothetical protein